MRKAIKDFDFSLDSLFIGIFLISLVTFVVVGLFLFEMQRKKALEEWRTSVIQRSIESTSSIYAPLIKNLVVEDHRGVSDILNMSRSGENLASIEIVPTAKIDTFILETCEVDQSQSFFHQVPTCFEVSMDHLIVYHELRSVGYNLGYLRKEFLFPKTGLLVPWSGVRDVSFIALCFLFITAVALVFLRFFIIRPINTLVKELERPESFRFKAPNWGIKELKRLSKAMHDSFDSIAEFQSKTKQLEYEARLGQMASQVAHDIRSPLAALQVSVLDLKALSEDQRILLRTAVQSIDDIANDLDIKRRSFSRQEHLGENINVYLIAGIIASVVSEKRIQFKYNSKIQVLLDINPNAYSTFCRIEPNPLRRSLSNIINNAIEAVKSIGQVFISAKLKDQFIEVEILDHGPGIPEKVIPLLMQKGVTHAKKDGTGLGLYYAKETVEKWNGAIAISSKEGHGTSVKVTLPTVPPPMWFLKEVVLDQSVQILTLDDDDSIHLVWFERFRSLGIPRSQILHFKSSIEFSEKIRNMKVQSLKFLCFVDFELSEDMNGLDLICDLGISKKAYLVTSRYEESEIQNKCIEHGVRMMPKYLAGFIPIISMPPLLKVDCVLIDDDNIVHATWKYAAEKKNIKLLPFYTPDDFYRIMSTIPREVPIYIDHQLGNAVTGEKVAFELFQNGFVELFMATGLPELIYRPSFIKAIVGKSPPF